MDHFLNIYTSNHSSSSLSEKWDDLQTLLDSDNIKEGHKRLLRLIAAKRKRRPQDFNRKWARNLDYYPSYASLLTMAVAPAPPYGPQAWIERFVMCKAPRHMIFPRKSFECQQKLFCPHCAHKKRWSQWLKFLWSFETGQFAFLTLSMGAIPVTTTSSITPKTIWDREMQLLSFCNECGVIDGYLSRQELHVQSIHPAIVVTPHVHAVVKLNKDATEDNFRLLWHEALEVFQDWDPEVAPEESVKLQPITSQKGWINAIGYLYKPQPLLKAYQSALADAPPKVVNPKFLLLFEMFKHWLATRNDEDDDPRSRVLTRAAGCFNGNANAYIGSENPNSNRADLLRLMQEFYQGNGYEEPKDTQDDDIKPEADLSWLYD